MGWKSVGNDFEPDGLPFAGPVDSFERAYNRYLERYGHPPEDLEDFPLSSRLMWRDPGSGAAASNLKDWFFDHFTQDRALEAGNTHEELDQLAREVLEWAIKYRLPITDAERNVAKRLGLDVSALGRKAVTRSSFHRLGI